MDLYQESVGHNLKPFPSISAYPSVVLGNHRSIMSIPVLILGSVIFGLFLAYIFSGLRGLPAPKMTRDDVLSLARSDVEEQGWPWAEPVHVDSYLDRNKIRWHVRTNAIHRGGNVNIHIDDSSRTVVSRAYARY
jgi:hypothetical protein